MVEISIFLVFQLEIYVFLKCQSTNEVFFSILSGLAILFCEMYLRFCFVYPAKLFFNFG